MKKVQIILAIFFFSASVSAQEHVKQASNHGAGLHIMVNTPNLKWRTGPASLPPGAEVSLIEGDPGQAGPFTMRIKLPANYRIGPHFHPAIEHVTVLEGAFFMGTGNTYNEQAATELKVSAFATMPIGYVHYAFTKTQPAVLQLHGIGPWGITYIHDADDPRKK